MAKYDLEADIKIYKDNRAKSLLCTRAILSVVFIVLFILGQKPYELLFIDALSYLIENILNYKKMRYKEDLFAVIALAILSIALIILTISKYV